nr:hypothetical protein [Pseudomonas benzenivorans]
MAPWPGMRNGWRNPALEISFDIGMSIAIHGHDPVRPFLDELQELAVCNPGRCRLRTGVASALESQVPTTTALRCRQAATRSQ